MSETVTDLGKLERIKTDLTTEEWCKSYCIDNGICELSTWNKTWKEACLENFSEDVVIVGDQIYKIFDHITLETGDDISIITENPDGTYSFVMQYYNGGTCLAECLEDEIKKINKKEI